MVNSKYEPKPKKQKSNHDHPVDDDQIMSDDSSSHHVQLILSDSLKQDEFPSQLLRNKLSFKTSEFVREIQIIDGDKLKLDIPVKGSKITDLHYYARRKWFLVGSFAGLQMFDAGNGKKIEDYGAEGLIIVKMCTVMNEDEEDFVFFIGRENKNEKSKRIITKLSLNGQTEYCFPCPDSSFEYHNLYDLAFDKEKNELFVLDESDGLVLVLDGSSLELKYKIRNKFTKVVTSLFFNDSTRELILVTGTENLHFELQQSYPTTLFKCYGPDYKYVDEIIEFAIDFTVNGMVRGINLPLLELFYGDGDLYLLEKVTGTFFTQHYIGFTIQSHYYDTFKKELFVIDNRNFIHRISFKIVTESQESPLTTTTLRKVEELGGKLPKLWKKLEEMEVSDSVSYFSSIEWGENTWFEFSDDTLPDFIFQFEIAHVSVHDIICIGSGFSDFVLVLDKTEKDFTVSLKRKEHSVKYPLSVFLSKIKPFQAITNSEQTYLVDLKQSFERLLSNSVINPQTLEFDKDELIESYNFLVNEYHESDIEHESIGNQKMIIRGKEFKQLDIYALASYNKMLVKRKK